MPLTRYTQDDAEAASRLRHLNEDDGRITLAQTQIECSGYIYDVMIILQPGTFPAGEVYGKPSLTRIRADGPAHDHPDVIIEAYLSTERPMRWLTGNLFKPVPLKKAICEWLDMGQQQRCLGYAKAIEDANYGNRISRGRLKKSGALLPEEPDTLKIFATKIGEYFKPEEIPRSLANHIAS